MLLSRVTLKGIQEFQTSNGVAWSATVCLDGQPCMKVGNDGNGGDSHFNPLPGGTYADIRTVVRQANQEAAVALGTPNGYECFANLLSAMDNNMTALEAVPHWQAAIGLYA